MYMHSIRDLQNTWIKTGNTKEKKKYIYYIIRDFNEVPSATDKTSRKKPARVESHAVLCLVTQPCATLCCPMDCSPPGSSVDGILQGRVLECPPPGDLPKPGIESRSPGSQANSLPSEPPGKTMNTGVGSLSLLQGIFPTPELNQGLLHGRWIPYQLSYQRSPENGEKPLSNK